MNQAIKDINVFLPKFYPKEQQISLTLNPLLKNIRDNKVSSYHQLQTLNSAHKYPNNQSLILPKHQVNVFLTDKSRKVYLFEQKKSPFKHKSTFDPKLASISYESKQIIKKVKKNKNPYLQNFAHQTQVIKNRNLSFNVRFRTSQYKKHKEGSITPQPAITQVLRKPQPEMQKGSFIFTNPQNQGVDLEDHFYNFIKFKIQTKGPYFTGGKFSKIKKHLVQEINLQDIEKNFHKTPSAVTKYKQFFEKILQKRKTNKEKLSIECKTAYKTIVQQKKHAKTILQKSSNIRDQKYDINVPCFSQNFEKRLFFRQKSRRSCPQNRRRKSVKANLFYKRSSLQGQRNQDINLYDFEKNVDSILITGKKKTFSNGKDSPAFVSVE